MVNEMEWFRDVFFKSLVERYNTKGDFKLSDKQSDICRKYMSDTENPDFFAVFDGYGIYQVGYSPKHPLYWKNGVWFSKI